MIVFSFAFFISKNVIFFCPVWLIAVQIRFILAFFDNPAVWSEKCPGFSFRQ
ncbi:hypothetical protein ALIPUT_02087 [Alistipes putredinis DSM 17216]|uniref:Uncharacterized protein n=1 Tax=Alistipes putredinis DSM 17216 TaxID=445970 RepID=B0MYH9_9BACT|nr:hypothetical protein ALIPUT_02087 [Alistipes putredinis DSM 17216]